MGKVWKSKKAASIILALALGVFIIVLAVKADDRMGSKVSYETVGDATWKEGLSVIPSAPTTNLLGTRTSITAGSEATTTTDRIAREMLVSYMLTQTESATTTLSDADVDKIVTELLSKSQVEIKAYRTNDLNLITETNLTTVTRYGEDIQRVFKDFSKNHTRDELVIFSQALTTNNTEQISTLLTIADQYKKLTDDLLTIKTPKGVATLHLRLVQSYANIERTIRTMANVHRDAVAALSALSQYRAELSVLKVIQNDYQNYQLP